MTKTAFSDLLRRKGFKLVDVARVIGVDKSQLTRWSQKQIPAERVLDIERVTGISRHDLRPDVFGPAEDRAA